MNYYYFGLVGGMNYLIKVHIYSLLGKYALLLLVAETLHLVSVVTLLNIN
jgi:hypothetical protein